MTSTRMAARAAALLLTALLAGCGAAGDTAPGAPSGLPWSWEMPECAGFDITAYDAPGHRLSVMARDTEISEVYEPGWAARAMMEIRAVVRSCGSYEHQPTGDAQGFRAQHVIVDSGFAGDDSILVQTVVLSPPRPLDESYAVVVRDGDLVRTVRASTRQQAVAAAHP
jgi:hypothetical protein